MAVQVWLDDLKTVASEADDAIEEFSYEVHLHPMEMQQPKMDKVRSIFSSNKHDSFPNEIAQRIRNISSELGRINKEAKKIGLVTIEITNEYDEFDPSKMNSEILGRVNDVSGVVDLLVNEGNEELSTVGLLGELGSGKTILAQLVYTNAEVKKCFTIRLWVSVFMDFTEERLLNKIVQSLHEFKSPYKMRKKEEAIKLLQDNMQKIKFLLVLDDVWIEDREKWERMRQCLLKVGGSRGSKILMTTHNDNVISTVKVSSTYHLGESLTEQDSWDLFKLQALKNGGEVESLDEVECRRMVNRFGGMPMPIKALANLVFGNKDEVLSSIMSRFNCLPSLMLKLCFSYCCIFPKNKAIEKDSLIQLWMAQGFLQPPKGNLLKMEDVGNKYFNILLQNSLLTELTFDGYNNIKTCKMHKLAHGFVSDLLKNYFMNIGEGSTCGEASSAVHLSVIVGSSVELINMLDVVSPKLRTLYIKGAINEDVLSKFSYIHVLILDDYAIEELPASIVKLKHLRCIDIFWTRVHRLPDSITKLHKLETLRLASCSKLPRNLESLTNLRHFYVKDCLMQRDYDPVEGIGSLVNLQTLSYFVVGQEERCRIEELGPLEQLQGKLKILRLENVKNGEEAKQANLLAKKKIQCLMFEWGVERKEINDEDVLEGLKPNTNLRGLTIVNYKGSKFPTWMVSASNSLLLHNIVKIKLWNCSECETIPSLGHLRHLRIVEIFEMHNVKRIGEEFYGYSSLNDISLSSGGYQVFPSLRKLHIHDMENLVEWSSVPSDNSVAFPCLEQLMVNKCNKLTCLPDMSGLECLEELVITECKMLAHLPELDDLVSLQKLRLTDDHSLEWIPDVPEGLCTLEILRCRKLEELPRGLKW
ncbi:hypothetical protein Leryth_023804 [Lithospermum erythrorhizon]|nr:hypothetical protein Leryth_023804 [Lithospermum erythrorhizon]